MNVRIAGPIAGVLVLLVIAGIVWAAWPDRDAAPEAEVAAQPKSRKTTFEQRGPEPETPEPAAHEEAEVPQPQAEGGPDGSRAGGDAEEDVLAGDPGDVEVSAWTLDKEGIRGAMTEIAPFVAKCYEDALVHHPDLGGKLSVGFEIEEKDGVGIVTGVGFEEATLNDGPLENCLLDHVEILQFDAPESGVLTVTYPFTFRPE